MLPLADLKKLNLKDLGAELKKARREWLSTKLSVQMNQDKKSHVITQNKRYVAQILTTMNALQKEQPQEK
ncbi:50S ribosomal protein L29 [Candidatus Peregrinibacteria bacterium]|jgi:ribosomal protein L29|nr:50S ribosomal protein L29 [Candidatus Peregrinibacteria bacterium]MBT7484430.1 50S ribosomal protein L29 [Candidatus Peregrinibacteria bacterium]MBT7703695.1 50S ribosomal protein L29 [Candidatus Peregrinibacteria bacterium]